MKATKSLKTERLLLFGLVTLVLSVAIGITVPEKASGSSTEITFAAPAAAPIVCPSPTVQAGSSRCVLLRDVIINKTLTFSENVTLDCQGHMIVSKSTGTGINIPSEPSVAIFLRRPRKTTVRNCMIAGFDFGIFAIDGKQPTPLNIHLQNKITGNKITARFVALSLMSVDNTRIENNFISFTTRGGRAVYVGRNSDRNQIVGNTIRATLNTATPNATSALRVPGPPLPSNPLVEQQSAVLIAQAEGPEPTLLHTVIDGKLYPLTIPASAQPNSQFSEHNEFEGNDVRLSGAVVDAVVISIAQNTKIRNNTIQGSLAAIRSGGQTGAAGQERIFPGRCKKDQTRFCLPQTIPERSDCNIPGIDTSDIGPCEKTQPINVFWVGNQIDIINNTVLPPFNSGISGVSRNMRVIGNTIIGPGTIGINIGGKFAVESAVVRGNVVSHVDTAFGLVKTVQDFSPSVFGAQVSENDFTNYVTAVLAREFPAPTPDTNSYDITSELSVGIRGNHWGTPCNVGLDLSKVKKPNGTTNTFVTDAHPYGTPVARMLMVTKVGEIFTPSEVNQPCVTAPSAMPSKRVGK